jgi:hypothetical protein
MRAPSGNLLGRAADRINWRTISGPLFRKYVALFVAVVCIALITNGAFEIYFSYHEHRAALIRIQREQAAAAAKEIDQFIEGIKSQVGWTTHCVVEPRWTRRWRCALLRQVPRSPSCLNAQGGEVARLATEWTFRQQHRLFQGEIHRGGGEKVYYGRFIS